jgi:hypothetical protein
MYLALVMARAQSQQTIVFLLPVVEKMIPLHLQHSSSSVTMEAAPRTAQTLFLVPVTIRLLLVPLPTLTNVQMGSVPSPWPPAHILPLTLAVQNSMERNLFNVPWVPVWLQAPNVHLYILAILDKFVVVTVVVALITS